MDVLRYQIKSGSTSNIFQLTIGDSSVTTGVGKTGLAFNTASLIAYYHKDLDTTATAISLVSMTSGTFTSGGFVEVDASHMPGVYQFCPPDAAFSSGKSVMIMLSGAANMRPVALDIQLTFADPTVITPVNVTQIDGNATNGNNATLNLKKLNIVNNAGDAIVASSTGSNGNGINTSGNGAGHGIITTGGTTGSGISANGGNTSGHGIIALATTSGSGIIATAAGSNFAGCAITGATNGNGLSCIGTGSGNGWYVIGGTTGNGMYAVGGATSGAGITATGTGNGAGLNIIGVGNTSILATQGISGPLDSGERTNIADALLKRDMSAVSGEASRSPLNCFRFLRNKWSTSSSTLTVTKEDDSTTAFTATITTNSGAPPIVSFSGN